MLSQIPINKCLFKVNIKDTRIIFMVIFTVTFQLNLKRHLLSPKSLDI